MLEGYFSTGYVIPGQEKEITIFWDRPFGEYTAVLLPVVGEDGTWSPVPEIEFPEIASDRISLKVRGHIHPAERLVMCRIWGQLADGCQGKLSGTIECDGVNLGRIEMAGQHEAEPQGIQ